jgi:UDP-N-acetylglucosamine 2-epimerase
MRERPREFEVWVCVTSQHREMLDQALAVFGIAPDFDLGLMHPAQALSDLTARILEAMPAVLARVQPDWVIVQGDTTTTFAAALSAFYQHVPVAHVEAGLRTGDLEAPFPEELNRRAVDLFADLCFAPTQRAADCLRSEGIDDARIRVVGNTGIDAILWAVELDCDPQSGLPAALRASA